MDIQSRYAVGMTDARTTQPAAADGAEPGYMIRVSDRTTAAMQLAAHFTAESMRLSRAEDPRARLAEQLSYFDLAFRAIMSSTARSMIRNGSGPLTPEQETRARSITSDIRLG
jgi:hypothetical protein